jgi:hypothetical protein
MKSITPKRTIIELDKVISAWKANADFTVNKEVTVSSLNALRKKLEENISEVTDKRTELTGLTNDRNQSASQATELITRIRSGFRAFYGPNSKQYEQVGGTRTDARKRPTRVQKPTTITLAKAA